MDEQLIISRETMRARGRKARAAGHGRDDHRMNWNADAIAEWQAGWDEVHTQRAHDELVSEPFSQQLEAA